MPTKTKTHNLFAKSLHWGFVLLYIYGISKGLENVDQLIDPDFLRFEIIFSIVFLLILILRFFYMRWVGASALPDDTPIWKMRAAKLGHLALYISIGMIALTGLMIGGLFNAGIQDGFLMNATIAMHEFWISTSYVVIAVHILAAIYHRLIGDGVWSAMVPIFKE